MNKLVAATIGLVIFMVIVIPGVIVMLMGIGQSAGGGGKMASKAENLMIHVYLHEQDKVETMPLEQYVKGVLGAEMPAGFEAAALEAQAVAARTYAVKNMRVFGGGGVSDHPDADVSTDFTKNQAWLDTKTLKERWGAKYTEYWQKISKAVDRTQGQILTYEDKPISALFHSTSAGRTASAKEVWGYDFPYLQSVECKWDEASPRYRDTKEISLSELETTLGADAGVMSAMQSGDGSIAKVLSLTESGRVKEVRIGSKNFTGQELRQLLGLRSENFTTSQDGNKLIFKTLGYGHGVGLCQYGANGMAKSGDDYQSILKHYYTDVALKNIYGS